MLGANLIGMVAWKLGGKMVERMAVSSTVYEYARYVV